MLSSIYESADVWYLVFVIVALIAFLLLGVFYPKDKNHKSRKKVDHE